MSYMKITSNNNTTSFHPHIQITHSLVSLLFLSLPPPTIVPWGCLSETDTPTGYKYYLKNLERHTILHQALVSSYLAFAGISLGRIREYVLEIFPCLHLMTSCLSALCVGLEELLVLFLQFLPHCGSDDWFDVSMFGEGFHAFFSAHIEDDALLYQALHHVDI